MTKPFGSQELVARLRAALRRAPGGGEEARVEADGLVVDMAARRVLRDGDEVHLTPTEFELLRILASHRGRLITHTMLLSEVWGPAYAEDTHVLRVHVANLRRKIEPEPSRPRYITDRPGRGLPLRGVALLTKSERGDPAALTRP